MFKKPPYRVILVTGAPRSGTTAIGKCLALQPSFCTLHEPFNSQVGIAEIERHFEIPNTGSFSYEKINKCIEGIYNLKLKFRPGGFSRDPYLIRLAKRLLGGRSLNSYRICKLNPFLETIIWKDPMACFVAGYVSSYFQYSVLVTVRNPWASAASFKRMNWGQSIHDLLPRLSTLNVDIDSVKKKIEIFDWNMNDPVVRGSILWYVIYKNIIESSKQNSKMKIVDIDAIISNPVFVYQDIYRFLEIPWSQRIEKKITRIYRSQSKKQIPDFQKAHDLKRDLNSVNSYWQKTLDPSEIEIVNTLNSNLWKEIQYIL